MVREFIYVSVSRLDGSATWTLTSTMRTKMRSVQRKMLRQILGIRWTDDSDEVDQVQGYVEWIKKATHIAVQKCEEGEVTDWVEAQKKRKWTWAGHCARRTDGRWTSKMLNFQLDVPRRRGRPCLRWSDEILQFLEHTYGSKFENKDAWQQVAQCRDTWKLLMRDFVNYKV